MRLAPFAALAIALSAASPAARAEDQHFAEQQRHMQHMAMMAQDTRQAIDYSPVMRDMLLLDMRDHMQSLSDILAALGAGKFADAGRIAEARLGMESPSAEGCREGGDAAAAEKPQMSQPGAMERQMESAMPEGMRRIGLEMHRAASDFAAAAKQAAKTGDGRPAFAALSRMSEKCVACHAAYKLQ